MTVPLLTPAPSTGDLVLLTGVSMAHKNARRYLGPTCHWTQTALLLIHGDSGTTRMMASTRYPICADMHRGTAVVGVQTVNFTEFLTQFNGAVAVRRVIVTDPSALHNALVDFERCTRDLPFKRSVHEMARAKCRRNKERDMTSYYCSEFVAAAYQASNVLRAPPTGRLANNYLPDDFGAATENLDLLDRVWFEPETLLKDDR